MDGVDLGPLWARALESFAEGSVPPQQRAWLNMTRPFGLANDTIILAAPNDFAKDVLETKLRPLIAQALSQEFGRPMRVAVMVDPMAGAEEAPAPRADGYPQAPAPGYPHGGQPQQGYGQPGRQGIPGPSSFPEQGVSSTDYPQGRPQAPPYSYSYGGTPEDSYGGGPTGPAQPYPQDGYQGQDAFPSPLGQQSQQGQPGQEQQAAQQEAPAAQQYARGDGSQPFPRGEAAQPFSRGDAQQPFSRDDAPQPFPRGDASPQQYNRGEPYPRGDASPQQFAQQTGGYGAQPPYSGRPEAQTPRPRPEPESYDRPVQNRWDSRGGKPSEPARLNPKYTFETFVIGASQPFRARRGGRGRRGSGQGVQPAVHLWGLRAGQDPPAPRDRALRAAASTTGHA